MSPPPYVTTARTIALAAICLGLAFNWLPPCLYATARGELLSFWVFVLWSVISAIGGFLLLMRIWESA